MDSSEKSRLFLFISNSPVAQVAEIHSSRFVAMSGLCAVLEMVYCGMQMLQCVGICIEIGIGVAKSVQDAKSTESTKQPDNCEKDVITTEPTVDILEKKKL